MPYASKDDKNAARRRWYAKNRDRYRSYGLNRTRRDKIRKLVADVLKGSSCSICGFSDSRALVFHHRDPSTKSDCVSRMVRTAGIARIKAEIDKCDVLCANCHAILHQPVPGSM